MSQFEQFASQLQSRIAKRSGKITATSMWKVGYRQLGRMKDWRECKNTLALLTADQVLDKRLLSVVQEIAYQNKLNAVYFEED